MEEEEEDDFGEDVYAVLQGPHEAQIMSIMPTRDEATYYDMCKLMKKTNKASAADTKFLQSHW